MRLHRLLLLLFPAAFRAEYGAELLRDLAARHREREGLARAALLVHDVPELLLDAIAAQWDVLTQDLRQARRSLRRQPGFCAAVVTVAALGIGANTAVFSALDRTLLRPLPYPEPDRLVRLFEREPGYGRLETSPANYRDWKAQVGSFTSIAAHHTQWVNLVGRGEPQRLAATATEAALFPMLGVEPLLGRLIDAADDVVGAPGVLLLSHALWVREFGADPAAIGAQVRLDDEPFTIVGVLPPAFSYPTRDTPLWVPLRLGTGGSFDDRENHYLWTLARLRPGVSHEQAQAEMDVIAARLAAAYPEPMARKGVSVRALADEVPVQARQLLLGLAAAAGLVLLVACANLANLLLARTLSRVRELSVRAALGAGRERLLRQILAESLLLAACGGLGGLALAAALLPVAASLVPTLLPVPAPVALDLRVLALGAGLTLVTGLGFGVLPALRLGARPDLRTLRETSQTSRGSSRAGVRQALVVAEVGAAVALMFAGGLLHAALQRVEAVDPGFEARGTLALQTPPPFPRYAEVGRREALYASVLDDVRARPGVTAAGYGSFLPMTMRGGVWPVREAGGAAQDGERPTALLRLVTPGFLEALGVPLQRGRTIAREDVREAQAVAVVSESFALRHWPGQDPLGRSFAIAFSEPVVVGVVGDVRVRGLERESEPQVYLSSAQVADGSLVFYVPKELLIRFEGNPAALATAARAAVHRADPDLPIAEVRGLDDIVAADSGQRRLQAQMIAAFGALAVLLAAVGLHGLLAFTVTQRLPEFGLRRALGASSCQLLQLVLGDGLRLAMLGCVVGALLGWGASRVLESLLFGVPPSEPTVALVAFAVGIGMTLAGSLGPALRALRADPLLVLRAD
ncbi:MAG: ABC transporter permease [Vicinamibacteria bacterium]|nr:ABC transporter permease [Vicinamibacteria bacterium]